MLPFSTPFFSLYPWELNLGQTGQDKTMMLLGTFWEHFENLMRISWEHDGNTLGKKGGRKKSLSHTL